jgi:hypothetical protein
VESLAAASLLDGTSGRLLAALAGRLR